MKTKTNHLTPFDKKGVKKLLLTMKITLFLAFFAVLQVSASNIFSQSKNVSIDMKNAMVRDVIREIESQSGINFFYNEELAELNTTLDISMLDKPTEEALKSTLDQAGMTYEVIKDDFVVLMRSDKSAQEQQSGIQGTVTDENGEPLPGVTIVVKGSTGGAITDSKGEFSLELEDPDAILVFSYVGYLTKEVPVGGQTVINVSMMQDIQGLEEVVVVGYGVQKKINLTGAVDVVTEEQIKARPVTSVTEALQGVSPNLNVSVTGISSEPGGEMALNIRGIGSLSGDYSPYILVDGVPMNLNLVNPNDIETLTVLKDAAASAIYGSRAPYGVILITTKKGKMQEKIQIEYSNNISFSSPIGLPHMADALKYASAHDQANVNAGLAPNFTPENYDRIRQYMAGDITEETWLKDDGSDWHGNGIWSIAGNGNNDWMYIYYKDKVLRQKHDVSVSGGGQKNSFFVSAGYWDQPGELNYGDEFYKRYNITANITSKPVDWLTFDLNTKYINDRAQYFNSGYGGGSGGRAVMYHNFYRTNVFRPRILPNGEYSDISNIDILNGGKEDRYGSNYIVSLGTSIEPIKNWVTTVRYNYQYNGSRGNNNQETVWGTFPDGSRYAHAYPISSYETTFGNTNYGLFNVISSYSKMVNDHSFMIMGGYENEVSETFGLWGRKTEVLTSTVPSISTATGTLYLNDNKSHWATESFFGRFTYNYLEKYLFEVNARYDGSSRFESESRWGFFPSVSVGYNISKENFWSSIEPYVSSLKIRGSWGSLGNQNVPNYLYLSTIPIGTNLSWIMGNERPNYTNAPGLVSANLTWETSTTTNVGLDAGFLEGKLTATFDVYSRITSEMFGPSEALPLTLGTDAPTSNNATLQTKGFELAIGWRDYIGKDLSYSVRATLADNVTTVTEYNNPTKTLSTWYEGTTLGEIWGLNTEGLYQTDSEATNGPDQTLFWPTWGAGDIHYQDLDGDGEITRGTWTADDAGDYSIIGNNRPRYFLGLSVGMKWKGFDFNMFWQGVLKRDYAFSGGDMSFFGFNGHQWWGMNAFEKGDDSTLDYWRPSDETNVLGPNLDAYYSKPYLSQQDYKNKQVQTRFMQNAAYFRLKNLSIGYTLPSDITSKINISNVRVFISGENLVTFSPLTDLLDPEALTSVTFWGVGKIHPLRKVYAVGINVTF